MVEEAEPVAFGIDEHDGRLVARLSDVGPAGAKTDQPVDLLGRIPRNWSQVDVDPVLGQLRSPRALQPQGPVDNGFRHTSRIREVR